MGEPVGRKQRDCSLGVLRWERGCCRLEDLSGVPGPWVFPIGRFWCGGLRRTCTGIRRDFLIRQVDTRVIEVVRGEGVGIGNRAGMCVCVCVCEGEWGMLPFFVLIVPLSFPAWGKVPGRRRPGGWNEVGH